MMRRRTPLLVYILLFALASFLVYLYIFSSGGYLTYRRAQNRVATLKRTHDSLQTVKARLAEYLHALQENDPFVLENEARKYWMVKPGEKVWVVRIRPSTDAPLR